MRLRRTTTAAVVCAVILIAFVVFLAVGAPQRSVLVVNNLLQTLSALGAGVVCVVVSLRGRHEHRRAWAAMAFGLIGWAAGQAYWSWAEIVAAREVPFPSLADVGFLVFPIGAAAATIWLQPERVAGQSRLRAAFDGLIVAASIFVVSWGTTLGPVFRAGADSWLAFAVSLAYPIGDMVVVALALLLMTRMSGSRLPIALLSLGIISMGVADSGFVFLTTAGTYHTGSAIDVGWVGAFLLCAVAAVADTEQVGDARVRSGSSRLGVVLPYAPFLASAGIVVAKAWSGDLDRVVIVVGGALLVLILLRQMLTLLDNHKLVEAVREREDQLRYQAFHDPLTGLANRLLFQDRLEHAIALQTRAPRAGPKAPSPALLFLDLDDFKLVNDRHGHGVGDMLLVDVAERLRASLRPSDTVARLGGDEFAVLLENCADLPGAVAERIMDAMQTPFQLGPVQLVISGSIGVAVAASAGAPREAAEELLRRADVAMYAAKRDGKGTSVEFRAGMQLAALPTPRAVVPVA